MSYEAILHDDEVRSFIRSVSQNVKHIKEGQRQFVGLLSAIVYKDVNEHFEEERGITGPWKKWSKAYREQMEEAGKGGNKILQDSGRLRQNFKPTNYKTSSQGITWFNNAKTGGFPYAWGHNEGEGKLPKRDFMWLSDKALEDISKQTLQFMINAGV